MKTWIAASYMDEILYLNEFNQAQQSSLTQLRILPFASWVQSCCQFETTSFALLHATQAIQAIKESLSEYQDMIQYPDFIEQILYFHQTLAEYQIPLSSLPEDTPQHCEMKRLVQCCESIITSWHQIHHVTKHILDVSALIYDPTIVHSLSMKHVLKQLEAKGMKAFTSKSKKAETISFFHALNPRQEIEACAQWICTHQIPLAKINIILCDPSNIIFLDAVFQRYQLNYGQTHFSRPSCAVETFCALVCYHLQPELKTLQTLLTSSLFNSIDTSALIDYLCRFTQNPILDYPFEQFTVQFETISVINQLQKENLLKLQQRAEQARLRVLDILNQSIASNPYVWAYDILRLSDLVKNKDERQCLIQIQQLLNSIGTSIFDKNDLACVLHEIRKIRITQTQSYAHRICVTDLERPVFPRKYSFILHGNQKNYPQFTPCNGLYEENYISQIQGYPTKSERAQFCSQYKSWIFTSGKQLFLSYATATYEGKGLECSFEIQAFVHHKSQPWPFNNDGQLPQAKHQIDPETAHQLFVKQNRIKGSISQFERYSSCPYRYFLHSGLHLRNHQTFEIDTALIGTIQHACIEQCIRQYKNNYATLTRMQLEAIVQPYFHELKQLYINQSDLMDTIADRIIENLLLQFEFLDSLEKNSDLTLHECEVRFQEVLLEEEAIPIEINGIIDRIDMNLSFLRVIDYKSSSRTISDTKIESGLQLQLITYLMMAVRIKQRNPLGTYYYSLKNENIPVAAAKLNLRRNELSYLGIEDYKPLWHHSHRLRGKTIALEAANDNDGTHIVNAKKTVDYEVLIASLLEVYKQIHDNILHGKIDCTPTESACAFCDFGSICRYHGQFYLCNIDNKQEVSNDGLES